MIYGIIGISRGLFGRKGIADPEIADRRLPRLQPVHRRVQPDPARAASSAWAASRTTTGRVAAEEVRHCASLGLRGAVLVPWGAAMPVWHEMWEPLWAAGEDTGLVVSFHVFEGGGATVGYESRGSAPRPSIGSWTVVAPLQMDEIMVSLILSGVCERHPRLRLVLGESGIGWLPYVLERLDDTYEERLADDLALPLPPSAYFKRQMYATFQKDFHGVRAMAEIAPDNVMWGSDYPHRDGTWPFSQKAIEEQFRGIPAASRRRCSGRTSGASTASRREGRRGLMREAERRREIRDYYLGISPDEMSSFQTTSFDLWESLGRYRRDLGVGARWLELGGGMGDLAAAALDRGYDVLMTDVQDELLATATARHPRLGTRIQRVDVFDARDVAALAARGPFSIVAALGAVLNHARDEKELARGFGHLVALGEAELAPGGRPPAARDVSGPPGVDLGRLPARPARAGRPGATDPIVGAPAPRSALALPPLPADARLRRGVRRADAARGPPQEPGASPVRRARQRAGSVVSADPPCPADGALR